MKKTCPFNLSENNSRLLWEITSRCNLRCRHCLYYDNSESALGKDLSYLEVCKIVDQIAANGSIKEIWLSGGEPLLRDDLPDIIRYIRSAGLMPSLSSNAFLITDDMALELHDAGIRYVHVSLDGTDAATHDELRQVSGAFERAVNGIKLLNAAGIMTGASFIVTEKSIDQVMPMLELAQSLSLSVISFYQVEPLGRAVGKNFGDRNDITHQLRQIQKIVQSDGTCFEGRIEFQRLFNNKEESLEACHGDRFLTITSDGKLGVCPWMMKSELRFYAADLLEDTLTAGIERCRQYISELKSRRKKSGVCLECQYKDICGQGCPAAGKSSEAYPYGFDSACSIGGHT